MTARTRQFYYVDTLTSTILDGDLISADRPQKVRQWRDVTGLPMCNGLDAISSDSVSTGTGFRSVAKLDFHSAMLVVKRTNKHCWDCYVLESDRFGGGSFVVWGWKNGWPEDVLCCHARQFQWLISTTSCDHFSIIYTHKKLKWYLELKQNKKVIECNVFFFCFFFVLSFLKGVDILSWKEINAICRFMVQCFLVESNSLLLKNGSFFCSFFLQVNWYTQKFNHGNKYWCCEHAEIEQISRL